MLRGNRVKLGPIKREYIDSYLKWFNDPEITQYLVMYRPLTRMWEEDWLENLKDRTDTIIFSISLLDDTHIGNCGLHAIDWKNRFGEAGITIGEKEYQGKGYGTEAMEILLEYGFNTVNLNRIQLRVYDFNIRAIKSYRNIGFIEEGRLRKAIFNKGEYHDILMMSILREEWNNK